MSALISAVSAGSLIEQIGSYAGIGSVIGLGIMALLYFSQAREVRRLREWAGREPERAVALAQRVQAEPQRRVVAQPLAPVTPAAQVSATAALYASVGATPPGTVAPAGQLARPAATPSAGLLPAPGAVPQPGIPGAVAPPAGALGAAAAGAAAAAKAPGAPAATPTVPPAPASGAPATGPGSVPTPSPGLGGPAASPPPPVGASAPGLTAAAQRSPSLSAYANGSTGQDTRESPAARPEPLSSDDDDGGISGARIAMFVGGGLAAVLAAVVLMLVLTGGEDAQAPNDFGNTPAQDAEPAPSGTSAQGASGAGASSGLTAAERRATKVAVLNGTTQTGLARNVGDKIEKARFTLGSIGTNADQQIPTTIIAYTGGHGPAARAVAKIVGVPVSTVQPADANASAAADGDVVVTVGLDQTG